MAGWFLFWLLLGLIFGGWQFAAGFLCGALVLAVLADL